MVVIRIIKACTPSLPFSIRASSGTFLMQRSNNSVLPIYLILNIIKHHVHALKLLLHGL